MSAERRGRPPGSAATGESLGGPTDRSDDLSGGRGAGLAVRVQDGVGLVTPVEHSAGAAAEGELRDVVARYADRVVTWRAEVAPGDRAAARWWRGQGFTRSTAGGPLEAPAVLLAARHLLGRVIKARGVSIRLTEVEAYDGPGDPASHARTRTARSEPMYGPPQRLYVYRSYGLHLCANVVTGPVGHGSAILMRAGQVVAGLELARDRRGRRSGERGPRSGVGVISDARLARGPGNLAVALGLLLDDGGTDLTDDPTDDLTVRLLPADTAPPDAGSPAARIRTGPRVGVSRAADRPWRIWLDGEASVSSYRRSPRAATGVADNG